MPLRKSVFSHGEFGCQATHESQFWKDCRSIQFCGASGALACRFAEASPKCSRTPERRARRSFRPNVQSSAGTAESLGRSLVEARPPSPFTRGARVAVQWEFPLAAPCCLKVLAPGYSSKRKARGQSNRKLSTDLWHEYVIEKYRLSKHVARCNADFAALPSTVGFGAVTHAT